MARPADIATRVVVPWGPGPVSLALHVSSCQWTRAPRTGAWSYPLGRRGRTSLAGSAHQCHFHSDFVSSAPSGPVMLSDNYLGIVFANKCKKQNGVANLVVWSMLIIRTRMDCNRLSPTLVYIAYI